MTAFTLDTSGGVHAVLASDGDLKAVLWSDLDAFTQGYMVALFESEGGDLRTASRAQALAETGLTPDDDESPESAAAFEGLYPVGFSDLAPETLARIIADCADAASILGRNGRADDGAWFWNGGARRPGFEPLTVQLSDAGKVIFA